MGLSGSSPWPIKWFPAPVADRVASVAVRGPDGETQVVRDVDADQLLTIDRA